MERFKHQPIIFIGPRRSGTTSIYRIIRNVAPHRTARIKEDFFYLRYKPDFEKYKKRFSCDVDEIVDFCPYFLGSKLAIANLIFLKKEHNFNPKLIVINREKKKILESSLNYFSRQHILKKNNINLELDMLYQQLEYEADLDFLKLHFSVEKIDFDNLIKEKINFHHLLKINKNINLEPLKKENSSQTGYKENFFSYLAVKSYRLIKKFVPEYVESLLKRIFGSIIYTKSRLPEDSYLKSIKKTFIALNNSSQSKF